MSDYEFEERAALMQFEGKLSKEEAERRAAEDLERLKNLRERSEHA